jgi:hypothetical protein
MAANNHIAARHHRAPLHELRLHTAQGDNSSLVTNDAFGDNNVFLGMNRRPRLDHAVDRNATAGVDGKIGTHRATDKYILILLDRAYIVVSIALEMHYRFYRQNAACDAHGAVHIGVEQLLLTLQLGAHVLPAHDPLPTAGNT